MYEPYTYAPLRFIGTDHGAIIYEQDTLFIDRETGNQCTGTHVVLLGGYTVEEDDIYYGDAGEYDP